jgi:MFS family permease
MNKPRTVIAFVNAAHFVDHYAMLIFAAAVIFMAPAFGLPYGDMLPYATPAFIAFGGGSLLTGWLGDRWSRRHMMVAFFVGIGLSMIAVGLVQSPLQLGAALLSIGLFASIYHPVGSAMIVSYADQIGREVGKNGVWGNLGVALSALVTGIVAQYLGWRWAFFLPGGAAILAGIVFAIMVRHEVRKGHKTERATVRVERKDMWRVFAALLLVVLASSTAFNAITVALPKLFTERLADITTSPALLGLITACVYVFGALSQYTIGRMIDRMPLKHLFLLVGLLPTPLLYGAAILDNVGLLVVSAGLVMGMFGLVTITDAMVGKFTADEWRSRAYSVRYFVGFTGAGAAISVLALLHEAGGFVLAFKIFAALCTLIFVAALVFPMERRVPEPAAHPAE